MHVRLVYKRARDPHRCETMLSARFAVNPEGIKLCVIRKPHMTTLQLRVDRKLLHPGFCRSDAAAIADFVRLVNQLYDLHASDAPRLARAACSSAYSAARAAAPPCTATRTARPRTGPRTRQAAPAPRPRPRPRPRPKRPPSTLIKSRSALARRLGTFKPSSIPPWRAHMPRARPKKQSFKPASTRALIRRPRRRRPRPPHSFRPRPRPQTFPPTPRWRARRAPRASALRP